MRSETVPDFCGILYLDYWNFTELSFMNQGRNITGSKLLHGVDGPVSCKFHTSNICLSVSSICSL